MKHQYIGRLLFGSLILFVLGCRSAQPTPVATVTEGVVSATLVPATSTTRPTFTPTSSPTLLPTITHTPLPLPTTTPNPSPTPTSTPQPTFTPSPPNFVNSIPSQMPGLLVVADGSLKKWNQELQQIENLLPSLATENGTSQVGEITDFSIDAQGQNLVAARLTADTPPTYDLLLVNLNSGDSQLLIKDIPYLLQFKMAPNGCCVAYMVGDPSSIKPDDRYQTPLRGTIYMVDLEGEQIEIGSCSNFTAAGDERTVSHCFTLFWSPTSQEIVWADAQGIWAHHLATHQLHFWQENFYELEQEFEVNIFMPVDWSPSGRYLRLQVRRYEGSSEAILDLQTGQLFDIPWTFFYEGPVVSSVSWMSDDRLFMVRTAGAYGQFTNFAEIWRIPTTQNQSELLLDWSLEIPTNSNVYLQWATQLENGRLAFAAVSRSGEDETAGLYLLEPSTEDLQRINPLPADADFYVEIAWLTSGNGALLIWSSPLFYEFVYLAPHDPLFYHVQPFFGHLERGISRVAWIE